MGPMREDGAAFGHGAHSIGDDLVEIKAGIRELSRLLQPTRELHPEGQVMRTALLIRRTNRPLRIVVGASFRAFMKGSSPSDQHPSLPELRNVILKIANQFRMEFTPVMEHGKYANLMTDTVTAGGRTWLSVCISTPRSFSFWRCLSISKQTADTLIDKVKEICTDLSDKGLSLCGSVTDNASNEIAAVRDHPERLGVPVFRIPCLTHTTTLALEGFVKDAFPLISGRDFFGAMVDLRNLLPHIRESDAFHGISRPCETRYTSLGAFADCVLCHRDRVCAILQHKFQTRADRPAAASLAFEVRFEQLAPCLKVLNTFVLWTESEDAFLTDAWSQA
jgi:hypothetical protein